MTNRYWKKRVSFKKDKKGVAAVKYIKDKKVYSEDMSSIVNPDWKLTASWRTKWGKKSWDYQSQPNIAYGQNVILDNHGNTLKIVRRRNQDDDWLTNLFQTLSFVISGN